MDARSPRYVKNNDPETLDQKGEHMPQETQLQQQVTALREACDELHNAKMILDKLAELTKRKE